MVKGHINDNLEIKVKLSILSRDSTETEVEAIVDTGFTGDMCLSESLVESVELDYVGTKSFELANGKIEEKEVFLGKIIFDDARQETLFIISESEDTLLGANLLKTKELYINYKKRTAEISDAV